MKYFYQVISIFLLLTTVSFAQAQVSDSLKTMEYTSVERYELGGIKVIGASNTDESALLNIAGFSVGEEVEIPGDNISKAIRKIYELNLFENVEIVLQKTIGDIAFLEIHVTERPRYLRHKYTGVKKSRHEDLNKIVERFVRKGEILTDNTKLNIINKIKEYYREKGYLDAQVNIITEDDKRIKNALDVTIDVERNDRVKVENITFSGNKAFKARQLRSAMKNTRTKHRIFAKSTYEEDEYRDDLKSIKKKYREFGYRDVDILQDSIWRMEDGDLRIHLKINEGAQYYFRSITWSGNSNYNNETLSRLLGIKKGDVFNSSLLEQRLTYSEDGRDVSALYMDNGHLFFRANPVITAIENDSVDMTIRIFEGPQATIDRVVITGNDRTHENVIRRELRTKPGEKFSRSDLIRSQRQLVGLGYFNPEALGINTPVNPSRYTVDIEYDVEEKSSDQLELSAGWNQFSGIIGTLGLQFNNFSIRNIMKKESWRPLPTGDGQRLTLRGQTNGDYFQSYNFSFTEPWLGGNKPTSLNVGGYYTKLRSIGSGGTIFGRGYLSIMNGFVGLGTRISWPDDNFLISGRINYENIRLNDYGQDFYDSDGNIIGNGSYNNITLEVKLARSSIHNPQFPTSGSLISLSAQFAPPYSLLAPRDNYQDLSAQDKFRFLEYHKWRFDFDWYTTVVGNLVFNTNAKIGFLGYYNKEIGLIPFERYEVGGSGLNNQSIGLIGREIISMRGYEVNELEGNGRGGGSVFNKFTAELRYPVSLNPSATIYALAFVQGGNVWGQMRQFNPFDLKKSTGLGIRAFLPMFGLIGFDYGIGFDKPDLINSGAKWTSFGQFNLVLGFEPD